MHPPIDNPCWDIKARSSHPMVEYRFPVPENVKGPGKATSWPLLESGQSAITGLLIVSVAATRDISSTSRVLLLKRALLRNYEQLHNCLQFKWISNYKTATSLLTSRLCCRTFNCIYFLCKKILELLSMFLAETVQPHGQNFARVENTITNYNKQWREEP